MWRKGFIYWIAFILYGVPLRAQSPDTIRLPQHPERLYVIIHGDTLPYIVLEELAVLDHEKYDRFIRYVVNTYPYARLVRQLNEKYEQELHTLDRRKDRRRYLHSERDELKEKFKEGVKQMSINEGKVLVKLIYRETGETAYSIIEKYLGSVKAFAWQALSQTGGASLKLEYRPEEGDDKIIEEIMQQVEEGKIYVPKEPVLPAKKPKEKEKKKSG